MFILTKFDSSHDSARTSFDDNVQLVIWLFTAQRTRWDKTVRDTLMLSYEVQKGPPHILNPSLRGFPGVAGSRPSSRLET